MSTLDLLSTDLTLTAPCGCSTRRAGVVDPADGSLQGQTTHQPCALHGAAAALLVACRFALAVLEEHVAASCDMCGGEGGWTEEATPRMTPVRHKADCGYLTVQAAIRLAEPPSPGPPAPEPRS